MVLSHALAAAQAAESACVSAAAAVRDPESVPASEAVRLYESMDRAGRAVAAAKVLLAKRVELAAVCPGHHDLHTNHGWALIAGTGKRPMVPPDDPRHPSHLPGASHV
jgi:hypothetical protein